jgi:hypothetical protein
VPGDQLRRRVEDRPTHRVAVRVDGVLPQLYTRTLERFALDADGPSDVVRSASPLVHTIGALVVLLGAVVLSVYKPKGLTRRGWRLQQAGR